MVNKVVYISCRRIMLWLHSSPHLGSSTCLVPSYTDVYRFRNSSVHHVTFSVDHLDVVDLVERDGVFCDCRLVFPLLLL